MNPTLMVGDLLYGYCRGEFGKEAYDTKRVEAVGADWVVARETREVGMDPDEGDGASPIFAYGEHIHELLWLFCHRNPDCQDN